jgi:hypothetical protein
VTHQREPNRIYLNGAEFCRPGWLMNGDDPRSPADGAFNTFINHAEQYATDADWNTFRNSIAWLGNAPWQKIADDRQVRNSLAAIRSTLLERISVYQNEGINFAKSADSPRFVAEAEFRDPRLVDRTTDQESGKKIDQSLTTLRRGCAPGRMTGDGNRSSAMGNRVAVPRSP